MKMFQRGLDIELKKFQGMEFRSFYELAAKVTEYEELLKEEKKSMETYCQEVNQEVAVADLSTTRTFICPLLVEKTPDLWKKAQMVGTQVQYTFEVAKIEEIFDFLVKEKFITFPKDHQILNKDELRGKNYYNYHNSWNHNTNACWGFRNVIHRVSNSSGPIGLSQAHTNQRAKPGRAYFFRATILMASLALY